MGQTSSTIQAIDWQKKGIQGLILLLGIFFLAKIWNVTTPLFHDELGVYGRALFYMVDQGPSMIPGSVDAEISRGHPLFFAFSIGQVSSWWGGSYVIARAFILLLSLALLGTTYAFGKAFWDEKMGLLATVIVAFQPIFFAQSTLVLPEIMLGLLGMLSLLFYVQKRYWLYLLVASLLVLTKETGIVIIAGIGLHQLVLNRFRIDFPLIRRGLQWAVPILVFIGFLVLQRIQKGWVFFPYHTSLLSFSPLSILIRMTLGLLILFLDQGRFILTIAAVIAYRKLDVTARKEILQKNALSICILVTMLVFSSLNYFMPRYFILVLPLVIMGHLSILLTRGYTWKHLVIYFLCCLPFQCNFFVFRNDDNMGYLIVVHNMQKSIAKLDEITEGKKVKVFAEFPEINALEEIRNGYTTNPNYVLTTKYDETVDYIIKSGNEHLIMDETINNVDYGLDKNVNAVINDPNSKMDLLYDETLFYNRQRIYKTNN